MRELPVTRPSLLLRLRDRTDGRAWEQFVDLYTPLVDGYFRRRGVTDADAADLAQEVLQAVVSGIGKLDYDSQRGSFRAWLYCIARNKFHHFLDRRHHGRGSGDSAIQQRLEAIPTPEDEAAWDREYEEQVFGWAAEQVRANVSESTWQAFWLTAVEGRSGQEVAAALGMGVGAVYMAKSRVLARLRSTVDEARGPADERQ